MDATPASRFTEAADDGTCHFSHQERPVDTGIPSFIEPDAGASDTQVDNPNDSLWLDHGDDARQKTATILVLDDRLHLRRLVSSCLENRGYGVITWDSPYRLQEVLEHAHPDLVLIDVWSGDVSLLQALVAVRRVPSTAAIPILVCAAEGERLFDRQPALQLLESNMLPMPFNVGELSARIDSLIR